MTIDSKIKDLIEYAKRDEDILAIILFGSFLKNNFHRDVDICLVLKRKPIQLRMSKKRLEYLTNFPGFDIQIFQQLPLYIRIRVLREGKVIYCSNESLLYDIAFQVIKEFEDFKPFYREYLRGVLHG
ncbi:MAG: nucleotidyltransferase domain-containing protein [Candidatus Altiarchaeales archaeon]|nr:MAG: nucleotidyltransferase domain-containing protein [Candidatus Altiarchaeales archaeon]